MRTKTKTIRELMEEFERSGRYVIVHHGKHVGYGKEEEHEYEEEFYDGTEDDR